MGMAASQRLGRAMLREPGSERCIHCGMDGLRWQWIGGRYRLVNAIDEVHTCAKGKAARRRYFLKHHPAIAQAARVRRQYVERLAREA